MVENLLKSRNSQRKKDRRMHIVFLAFTTILIVIFLTPFYFLVTDPQAPQLIYQSSVAENIRVSTNRDYITSDWNFTFLVQNTDRVYSFFYESINVEMVDQDENVIGVADQPPPFFQGTNTEKEIVFKFRDAHFPISEWTENYRSKRGKASGEVKITISMRWKLNINGGSKPRSRYTILNVHCGGSIEFSFNNSQNADVYFLDGDENYLCEAHLAR